MSEYAFEANNITKRYNHTLALDNVSMQVKQGDIYGFIGENGAGKTTMIRLLTGLAKPSQGEISLFGKQNKDLQIERKKIGCIIESPALYMDMTAKENLKTQMLQKKITNFKLIENLLDVVGLSTTNKKKAKDFSLGMRQRLALAIALVNEPKLLVLDEPTNGLDPTGIIEIRKLLKYLNDEKGITILISTHILSELYMVASSYGIIHKGKMLRQITANELDQMSEKYIRIKVTDSNRALQLLKSNFKNIRTEIKESNMINIYGYTQEIGKISTILYENDMQVLNIENITDSLEKYYEKLIAGGEKND